MVVLKFKKSSVNNVKINKKREMLRLCTLIILILTIEINAGGVLFDQFCNLKLNTTG